MTSRAKRTRPTPTQDSNVGTATTTGTHDDFSFAKAREFSVCSTPDTALGTASMAAQATSQPNGSTKLGTNDVVASDLNVLAPSDTDPLTDSVVVEKRDADLDSNAIAHDVTGTEHNTKHNDDDINDDDEDDDDGVDVAADAESLVASIDAPPVMLDAIAADTDWTTGESLRLAAKELQFYNSIIAQFPTKPKAWTRISSGLQGTWRTIAASLASGVQPTYSSVGSASTVGNPSQSSANGGVTIAETPQNGTAPTSGGSSSLFGLPIPYFSIPSAASLASAAAGQPALTSPNQMRSASSPTPSSTVSTNHQEQSTLVGVTIPNLSSFIPESLLKGLSPTSQSTVDTQSDPSKSQEQATNSNSTAVASNNNTSTKGQVVEDGDESSMVGSPKVAMESHLQSGEIVVGEPSGVVTTVGTQQGSELLTSSQDTDSDTQTLAVQKSPAADSDFYVYFRGKKFNSLNDPQLIARFKAIPWMTYRSGLWNDSGWGCMHRGGQMLLCNSLFRHCQIEPTDSGFLKDQASRDKYVKIIKLFLDSPWSRFSLQNIAIVGQMFDVDVGSWFGPTTISNVLQYLSVTDFRKVAHDIATARKNVLVLEMDRRESAASETAPSEEGSSIIANRHRGQSPDRTTKKRDAFDTGSVDMVMPTGTMTAITSKLMANRPVSELNSTDNPDWIGVQLLVAKDQGTLYMDELPRDRPALILIPVMLGAESLNEIYHESVFQSFQCKYSMGILGGKPNSALYFVGYTSDKKLLYLDPHLPQVKLQKLDHELPEESSGAVGQDGLGIPHGTVEDNKLPPFTAEDFTSYHCSRINVMDVWKMDPSLLLAFYYRNGEELDDFVEDVKRRKLTHGPCPLFQLTSSRHDFQMKMAQTEEKVRGSSSMLDDADDF